VGPFRIVGSLYTLQPLHLLFYPALPIGACWAGILVLAKYFHTLFSLSMHFLETVSRLKGPFGCANGSVPLSQGDS
jgi:hypothetical protein